jgi:hypothetical protein
MQPLLEYFRGRTIWTVDADSDPPQLREFSGAAR